MKYIYIILFSTISLFSKISAMETPQDRQAAVAGQFYPANKTELKTEVEKLLKKAKYRENKALAVVSPHAGYVFSGQVMANAINQINPDKKYDHIFVIGISHHKYFDGASIYNLGNYIIPGAIINVDTNLATKLISSSNYFFCDKQAHDVEHSVEVQLPFLFYHLKHKINLIPILIGTQDTNILHKIADILQPYFNEKNAFIFSSDFSHYPSYKDAIENDKRTAQALISNDVNNFIRILKENKKRNIAELHTSACGTGDLLVLLYLTAKKEKYKYKIIDYKNSGDSPYGGKDRVVGYYALSVEQKNSFNLSEAEKKELLKISRQTLDSFIKKGIRPKIDSNSLTENLKKDIGAFVTLTINGKLRGCIGRFMPKEQLYSVVQEMTIAAATQDSRFERVKTDELNKIRIEISVLTPLQKISSANEIKIGRDGIYIKKGIYSGTLLPQVATENNWDRNQFLEYCSQYKAGLGKDGWKKADLFIYQAIIFHETTSSK